MSQNGPLDRLFRRHNCAVAVLFTIVAALSIYQQVSRAVALEPQPQRQSRRRPNTPSSEKGADKYSNFTHESHGKNAKDPRTRSLKCNDCHLIPSGAEPDRIAATTKPSAAQGYPYHDSCMRCHERQFYRGDRPAICTVCHSRVAVRLTSRDVYSQFPSSKRGDIMTREFPGYYPHGLHQSLMALKRQPARDMNAGLILRRISFGSAATDKTPPKEICASCHFADERGPMTLPLKGIQSDDTFKRIEADTFKTIPGFRDANAHASCFTCHWDAQKPTRDDCNGCHLATSDYQERKLEVSQPPAFSSNAMRWFESWPAGIPKRFSLKFRHNTHSLSADGKTESNNHDLGCTTCHVNMTQMTTLNIPKADVRIVVCAPCHNTTAAIPVGAGVKVTIFDEMTSKADSSKSYTCVACHSSVIGREQPPCTHYSAVGQACPKPHQSGAE